MVVATMRLQIEDFTGQFSRQASGIPRNASIGDLVDSVSSEMQLPQRDAQGRPILYGARSTRGEMLNPTDLVGDVLDNEETLTLTKSVTAG